jgi:hypothetical protein
MSCTTTSGQKLGLPPVWKNGTVCILAEIERRIETPLQWLQLKSAAG